MRGQLSSSWAKVLTLGAVLALPLPGFAQDQAQTEPAVAAQDVAAAQDTAPATDALLTPDEIDTLIGPVALFTDNLLAQVLTAATYPLDVAKAGRFLAQSPDLSDAARADAVAQKYQRFMAELLKDPADRDPEIMKDVREFKDFISREFHAMRVEERTDFGQLAQKVMHQHSVSGGVLVAHKHHVSFQRFVEDAGKEIVVKANNEQEALVMGTRQLLMQNPSVIDELQQEDHEAHTARLAALPKKANR
jgi:hypothetical protein